MQSPPIFFQIGFPSPRRKYPKFHFNSKQQFFYFASEVTFLSSFLLLSDFLVSFSPLKLNCSLENPVAKQQMSRTCMCSLLFKGAIPLYGLIHLCFPLQSSIVSFSEYEFQGIAWPPWQWSKICTRVESQQPKPACLHKSLKAKKEWVDMYNCKKIF